MNILLSSAGKRNYLIHYFRAALGGSGLVLAADAAADAPALEEADIPVLLPAFTAPEYAPALLEVCREHKVGLLVPLNDIELAAVAGIAPQLWRQAGTTAAVSSPGVVQICLDKLASLRFLDNLGLRVPVTYSSLPEARAAVQRRELEYPVVVKPRWGSGSIGLFRAETDAELDIAVRWCARGIRESVLSGPSRQDPDAAVLIQETLTGQEYGFDVINDFKARHLGTLSRLKLGMRGGETDKAMTVKEPELNAIGRTIGMALGHRGVLDCDAIRTAQGWAVIDLNPRFGGGYPFSHAAGANVPSAMLAWAAGEQASPSCFAYADGVISTKAHHVVIHGDSRRHVVG